MKITVLSGGMSPERDVSLSSACLIANALIDKGHEVCLVDVYEGVLDSQSPSHSSGTFVSTRDARRFSYTISSSAPDLAELKARNGNREELVGPGVLDRCKASDLVFIGLHGGMGENGQIQAFLDVYAIPYTGSGYAACLLAMNKDVTKRLIVKDGIPTADWVTLSCGPGNEDFSPDMLASFLDRVSVEVGFPCVVKPCSAGSSVGVSMVDTKDDLSRALSEAFLWEKSVVVEKKIVGREFSVGVLDGIALPAIEIVPRSGFYNYENKYQAGLTEEICPARLTEREADTLGSLAKAVHACLGLGSYSRIDFILDRTGTFWCLEANTLPGMTPTSLLPQEARAVGISYGELCDKIAKLGVR